MGGKKILILAAALSVLAVPSQAFLWWRDGIDCLWSQKSMPLSSDDAAWSDADAQYEPGIAFRAKNDASNLYLHLTADGMDGRAIMAGAFRQDLTLWFLKPDGKTRSWGVRVPFGRLPAPLAGSWQRVDPDDAPDLAHTTVEMVLAQGVSVSTASLPPDVQFRSRFSGRDPVYTLIVPLQRIRLAEDKPIAIDFTSSAVGDSVKRLVTDWDRNRSRSHHSAQGDSRNSRPSDDDFEGTDLPKALKLKLAVKLAAPTPK